jgi:sugar lactone lactonase YvrE
MGPEAPPPTRGTTGQVTRVGPGGAKTVVARGLPSYAISAAESTGPAGLVASGGALWLAVGGAGPGTAMIPALPNENSVVRINPQTGAITRVADIGALERSTNPDGLGIDSNLYGLALAADGNLYVADAGGNSLYRVNPNTGQTALVTSFPGLAAPPGFPMPPGGNPERGGRAELDPVPTGVAAIPGGGVYVGFLSGGPFPAGAAKVSRVAPNGQVSDAATGLTAVVSVAVGPDRMLYVTEIFAGFNLAATPPGPNPGRVRRILPNGSSQIVADGLNTPNGIAFDRTGNLYVATNSAFGPPTAGQLLRCDRVASPGAGLGLPSTGDADGSGATPDPRLTLMGIALAGALGAGGLVAVGRMRRGQRIA